MSIVYNKNTIYTKYTNKTLKVSQMFPYMIFTLYFQSSEAIW